MNIFFYYITSQLYGFSINIMHITQTLILLINFQLRYNDLFIYLVIYFRQILIAYLIKEVIFAFITLGKSLLPLSYIDFYSILYI